VRLSLSKALTRSIYVAIPGFFLANMAASGNVGCSIELQWLLSAYFSSELKLLLKIVAVNNYFCLKFICRIVSIVWNLQVSFDTVHHIYTFRWHPTRTSAFKVKNRIEIM